MIIQPNGAPGKQKVEPMSREDVKRIIEFEQWLHSRKLSFDLYCNTCADTLGPKGARCWGNNSRDDNAYKISCQCTERVYGNANTPRRQIVTEPEKKIQVLVP